MLLDVFWGREQKMQQFLNNDKICIVPVARMQYARVWQLCSV